MLSEPLLVWTLAVLGVLFVGSLAVIFGHGLLLRRRLRRTLPRLEEGRRLLRAVAAGGDPAAAAATLRRWPMRLRVRLLTELSRSLAGDSRGALGELARETGVSRHAEAITRSPLWWRRLRGARLLSSLGGSEETMLPLLADADPAVRAQAAEWAAEHPTGPVIRTLLEMLADPNTLCRFTVQDSLLRLGGAATEPLAEFLSTHHGPVAAAALEVAGAVPDPRLLPSAMALCGDPHPATRARAVALLGSLGGPEAADAVTALLADPAAEVRAAAAQAAAALGHWPAAAAVARLLRDPAWEVRRAAGLALSAMGSPGRLLLGRYRDDADRFAADMARQVLDLPQTADAGGR